MNCHRRYLAAGALLAVLVARSAVAKPVPVQDMSITGMEARIVRLERLLNPGHQLQLYQQLTTLQQELEGLRGTVERSQYRLQQMEQQLKSLMAERPQLGESKPTAAKQPSIGASTAVPSDKPLLSKERQERAAYERAWQAVKSLPAAEAIQRLEQFIQDYPQSSYLPNAYYWLGQLLFRQGELPRASHCFATVLQVYPKSEKCSDAMLKIGFITQKQGDALKAKAIYQRVIQQYPSSSSAEQAKARLAKLK